MVDSPGGSTTKPTQFSSIATLRQFVTHPYQSLSSDGDIITVNDAWLELLGYGRTEVEGRWFGDFLTEDSVTTFETRFAEFKSAGAISNAEFKMQRADETTISVLYDGTIEYDEDGTVLRTHCQFTDVTTLKQQERKLDETNTVLRTIVEQIPMGILVEDADRDVIMANERLLEVFDVPLSAEDLIGRDCAAAAKEFKSLLADSEEFVAGIDRLLAEREPVCNEELALEDGRVIERDYVPYTLPAGEANLWLYDDVTERKQRKQKLERTSRFLKDTQEIAEIGGWEYDLRTESLRWSDELYRIHGLPLDANVTPEKAITFYHPDDQETIRQAFTRLTTEGDPYDLELRIITQDDDVRWVRTRGKPRYEDGELVVVHGMFQDITERKEQEQQLRREKERLDEFASVVSHDLRNPLNVAQGRIELAQTECDTEHLDPATAAIDRGLALIEDMLELARAGQEISDTEPVAIAALAEACWETVETADATLQADLDTTICADRTRLRQLLENVFRNAVNHGDGNVTVRIGALDEGFYIEDSGPGIPEEERDNVWETGYSSTEGGTGIGLAIVKQIADAHDWTVRVTTGSNGGARFEITGVEIVIA